MEFGKTQKLPDGRYFLKITGQMLQLNNVKYQEGTLENIPQALMDKLDQVDQAILTEAKNSKVAWFGRELSDETIQNAFQSSLTDGSLGVSLAKVKGEVVTKVFNSQKEEIGLSNVTAGSQCDVLVDLSGLWFLKKSFGPIWRVVQMRVRSQQAKPTRVPVQYMFEDEDLGEDDDPTDYVD
jgi:hypothetical protein